MTAVSIALPAYESSDVVVPAPDAGPGNWSGASSAALDDDTFWLAYRVRRPLSAGRGVAVVIARSTDGVNFEPVAEIARDTFGAESFERPALVRRPDGGWRIYLSCATPNSKHWWIEALDAAHPQDLPTGQRTVVIPGNETEAFKDPVVRVGQDGWQMWVCRHPLDEVGAEDRMTSWYATSPDGLAWRLEREVLAPRAGAWDARGARITAVVRTDPLTVLYDGRATLDQNWFERTGVAIADGAVLRSVSPEPSAVSGEGDGALRYADVLRLADGSVRYYFEAGRADGAHDLRTLLVPAGSA